MRNYLFLFLFILVPSANSLALVSVTASHTRTSNWSGYFNVGAGMGTDGIVYDNREAQTFTATAGGLLNTISFVAKKMSETTADLRVTLTELTGNQPGGFLATKLVGVNTIPLEDFGHWDIQFNATVDFSSENLLIEPGKKYAIIFSSDTTEANYRIYGDDTGYSGGMNMSFQNSGPYQSYGGDLFFEATVNSVPEPSSLMILATASFIYYRKRRTNGV